MQPINVHLFGFLAFWLYILISALVPEAFKILITQLGQAIDLDIKTCLKKLYEMEFTFTIFIFM